MGQAGFGLLKDFSIQKGSYTDMESGSFRGMRIKKIIRAVIGLAGSYDTIHTLAGISFM